MNPACSRIRSSSRTTHGPASPEPHAGPGHPSGRLAVRELVPDRCAAGRRSARFRTRPSWSWRSRPASGRVALGQPLDLSWTMTNTSGVSLRAPNDVSIEALFASITVTDGEGRERPVRPFAIVCEHAKLSELEPGKSLSASTKVFWSTAGSRSSGRAAIASTWPSRGRRRACPVGVQSGVDVFVDYPTSDGRQPAADLVLHPEVGKWVALGGEAYHLGEACRRLQALSQTAAPARARGARAMASRPATCRSPACARRLRGPSAGSGEAGEAAARATTDAGARGVRSSSRLAKPRRVTRAKKSRRTGRKG